MMAYSTFRAATLAALAASVLLAGCGGGGSSGGGSSNGGTPAPDTPSTPPVANAGVSFSPSSIQLTATEGDASTVTITATANSDFPGTVNVAVIAPSAFAPGVQLDTISARQYRAQLRVAADLKAGTYDGVIKVWLCKDAADVCAQPHAGAPWSLPYHLVIKPLAATLSPLSAAGNAGDWLTYQGSASHTGYVDVTVEAARISPRFVWVAPNRESPSMPAISNGLAFVTTANALYAIDEASGATRWSTTVPVESFAYASTPPAVHGTQVLVATSGTNFGWLRAFDAASGMVNSARNVYSPTVTTPPVADADVVLVKEDGGAINGLTSAGTNYRVAVTGASNWNALTPPTLLADRGYAYNHGTLYRFDKRTGAIASEIAGAPHAGGTGWFDTSRGSPVPLDDTRVVVTEREYYDDEKSALTVFDVAAGTVAWHRIGAYGEFAVAKGIIYVARGKQVVALRGSDGADQWSWDLPASADADLAVRSVVVTNNLLFVGSTEGVYAIDLATRKTVWSTSGGGTLALSKNGILYVRRDNAPLRAFNTH